MTEKLTSHLPSRDGVLVCPECESEWVHLGPVRVEGHHAVRITGDAEIESRKELEHPQGRGSIISVEMFCEQGGHSWTFSMQFHKGQTIVKTHSLRTDRGWITDPPAEELWRD